MITIVISACLLADPSVCRDHRVPLLRNIEPSQCVQNALPHFAGWAAKNPGWEIKRWRCTTASVEEI